MKNPFKSLSFNICKKSKVALGIGHVVQFILFEWKYLFSIIFYKWHTVDQVRFHTHAFPAVAILLKGSYEEEGMDLDGTVRRRTVNQRFVPRWLPRDYTHRILESEPGTRTLVLAGRWKSYWFEYFEDTETWVMYEWGRKKVGEFKNSDPRWSDWHASRNKTSE